MGEFIAKAIGALFVIAIVVYLLMIAAILALVLLGLASLVIAKSGKALVYQERWQSALLSSVKWSGTITTGCMLGSIGLIIATQYALDDTLIDRLKQHYYLGLNGDINEAFVYNWLLADSYMFFTKVAIALYFSNRIYMARQRGGTHWLQVLPPLFAMVLFFCADHGASVLKFLTTLDFSEGRALAIEATEDIWLPIDLLIKAVTQPVDVLLWGKTVLLSADGSVFKLGKHFPSLFCVVAVVFSVRALFQDPENVA